LRSLQIEANCVRFVGSPTRGPLPQKAVSSSKRLPIKVTRTSLAGIAAREMGAESGEPGAYSHQYEADVSLLVFEVSVDLGDVLVVDAAVQPDLSPHLDIARRQGQSFRPFLVAPIQPCLLQGGERTCNSPVSIVRHHGDDKVSASSQSLN
jgi:hypothetical protein